MTREELTKCFQIISVSEAHLFDEFSLDYSLRADRLSATLYELSRPVCDITMDLDSDYEEQKKRAEAFRDVVINLMFLNK